MRYSFILIYVLLSCKNDTGKKTTVLPQPITNTIINDTVYIKEPCDTLQQKEKIDISFRTTLDTIRIAFEDDTLVYSKEDFNQITDNFPELHASIPNHPDVAYYESGIFKDILDDNGKRQHLTFGSEVGQDRFCMIYAYFMKKENTFKGSELLRNKLLDAARTVRQIFQKIARGGTFYGHQYQRIYGYVEYWMHYLESLPDENIPGFQEEKKMFLATFKKEIMNMIQNDSDLNFSGDREKMRREVLPLVNKLDTLISSHFILRTIQEYRYSYY